jgi:hypothetical protein
MHQHVGPFIVDIVGNQEASRPSVVCVVLPNRSVKSICQSRYYFASAFFFASMHHLNQLGRLAARRGTQIQNRHSRLEVHDQWRYHTHNFLTAYVSHVGLGHKELLERCERRKASNNILRRGHEPSQLVRIPRNCLWWFNDLAFVCDRSDLRNVVVLQSLLNCQSMPV